MQTLMTIVLLVYDTLLTLPTEVEFIWGKAGPVTAFYLMARYAYIVYGLGYIVSITLTMPDKVPCPLFRIVRH